MLFTNSLLVSTITYLMLRIPKTKREALKVARFTKLGLLCHYQKMQANDKLQTELIRDAERGWHPLNFNYKRNLHVITLGSTASALESNLNNDNGHLIPIKFTWIVWIALALAPECPLKARRCCTPGTQLEIVYHCLTRGLVALRDKLIYH